MMRGLRLLIVLSLLSGCGGKGTTRTEETGYKGKARLDAYLAAERFLTRMGHEVINQPGWPELNDAAVVMVPASVLSTDGYLNELRAWTMNGGHVICLLEHAESYRDDWARGRSRLAGDELELAEPLTKWLEEVEISYEKRDKKRTAEKLTVEDDRYGVFAESVHAVAADGGKPELMVQRGYGEGILTVMVDARPFRNRYIGDHQHAELLLAMVDQSPYYGAVVIIRDGGLSLWAMLWRHGWPALVGLLVLTGVWLWKNMPRFGPMRRQDEVSNLRDYAHHLEALGDFQWRLDKGAAMLRPLRDSVLERAMRAAAVNHRDGDLFDWMAQRVGITRERAERAMTNDRPSDPTAFTRIVADLQLLHLSLP